MVNWIHQTARLLRHRWAENLLRSTASPALLGQLTQAVATSEQRHSGQVRICIEAGLPASYIWRNASARERAIAMFSKLRVWDTEHNNGVLIYLLLAEHAIEIVADCGIAAKVEQAEWQAVCRVLEHAYRHRKNLPTAFRLLCLCVGRNAHAREK